MIIGTLKLPKLKFTEKERQKETRIFKTVGSRKRAIIYKGTGRKLSVISLQKLFRPRDGGILERNAECHKRSVYAASVWNNLTEEGGGKPVELSKWVEFIGLKAKQPLGKHCDLLQW